MAGETPITRRLDNILSVSEYTTVQSNHSLSPLAEDMQRYSLVTIAKDGRTRRVVIARLLEFDWVLAKELRHRPACSSVYSCTVG